MMTHRSLAILWIFLAASSTILAVTVPVYNMQKRQSDQRIAELETLLSLHKYGVGRRVGGRNSAGYGLIDFNYIGRKKKSQDEDDHANLRNSENANGNDFVNRISTRSNINQSPTDFSGAPKTQVFIMPMKAANIQPGNRYAKIY